MQRWICQVAVTKGTGKGEECKDATVVSGLVTLDGDTLHRAGEGNKKRRFGKIERVRLWACCMWSTLQGGLQVSLISLWA